MASGATAPTAGAAGGANSDGPRGIWAWSSSGVTGCLRVTNLCNGLILSVFAIIAFLPLTSSSPMLNPTFTTVTVGAYVILLGLFMCCMEVAWACMNNSFRRLCGFYFSYLGRAIVIFFSGARVPGVRRR